LGGGTVGNGINGVYATGGLAIGGVENKIRFPTFTAYSDTKTRVGWTIGGGVEHMWTPNWTIGLEALFVDLGRANADKTLGKTTKFSNQAVIGRVKLNYKF